MSLNTLVDVPFSEVAAAVQPDDILAVLFRGRPIVKAQAPLMSLLVENAISRGMQVLGVGTHSGAVVGIHFYGSSFSMRRALHAAFGDSQSTELFARSIIQTCNSCHRELPASQFRFVGENPRPWLSDDGYSLHCIECEKKVRGRKLAVHGTIRQVREHHAEGSHTEQEWQDLKQRFGNGCVRCRISASIRPLTKDHVVPLTSGGTHCIGNIQPLCGPCNSSKGARFIDFRGTVSQ